MAPSKKKIQSSKAETEAPSCHRKTRSSPRKAALRLARVITKTRSWNTVSPSTSSPTSAKKKPISENLKKKLSKKKKKVDPVTPDQSNEGIKLLKRGCVTMHRIVKRKIMHQKLPVSFNAKGVPYGDAAAEMQSYIGVLARTKAPIWHDTWKEVPEETKNKIWECVQMAFVVPPTAKKLVRNSACAKWREFKCRLTKRYVLPYRDQPEKLKFPPADYTFIEKSHWDIFVVGRLGDDFMKLHEDQVNRGKMNEYPHRMSRKGYANIEHEWLEEHPDEEIDRSETWVLARKDKNGNYKNDKVKEKAEEIDQLKKKVREGELEEQGMKDVLGMALGKPEHAGRVRGQGGHVKQSVYFDLPKQKKARTIDERIREGVNRFMAEETPKIIQERDAFWAAEIEKIKAELLKGVRQHGSPNSQQGSCSDSKAGPRLVNQTDANELAKKRLNVDESIEAKEIYADDKNEESVKVDEVEAVKVDDENEGVKKNLAASSGNCQLAIGSLTNIVAYGKIDEVQVIEGCVPTLHGVRVEEENARVSITHSIQGDVMIPFPVGDEIVTVQQAVGSFIAWPRDMLVVGNTSSTPALSTPKRFKKRARRKVGDKKKKNPVIVESDDEEEELHVEMGVNYPSALKRLWTWAKAALTDGRTVCFQLSEEAFAATKKQVIFLQDIHALCGRGEISGSTITIFIHFLYEYIKKNKMSDMVAFVDPSMVGAVGCGNAGERSDALATRFMNAKEGQYFLIPFNDVNHWSLTVALPTTEVVYHMDPLKRRIASDEWVEVVDNSIKIYKERLKKVARKKILWENMAGVPLQTGVTDCGLFVMRYMKEICFDKEFGFAAKWMRRGNLAYGEDDINEIKMDFAKFFMKRYSS